MARIDLKIDDELLEKIYRVAEDRFKAKPHHISKKPEITLTISRLIQYGIEGLESGLFAASDTDKVSVEISDNYLVKIAEAVGEKLSGNLPVINPDNVLTKEEIESAIVSLKAELAEFDKGFQGLGAVVHDHDRVLGNLATRDEVKQLVKHEVEQLLGK